MTIEPTPEFLRDIKALRKKYPSIPHDLEKLYESLQANPQQGQPLGRGCYKVRFAIASQSTGKRDSSRLITCVQIQEDTLFLLKVYEKSERATVKDKELTALLKQIE